jgi:hypothetical protein
LTLDDDVENRYFSRLLILLYRIEIPEHGSGSELFFFSLNKKTSKESMKMKTKQIIKQ